MSRPPARPKIYHITHVDNLKSIVAAGELWSDATMISANKPPSLIGMSAIKKRRLNLPVTCHQGDSVGDYVSFFFCPRSIMLYVIHRANHPDLTYRGGQRPIIHLQADLHSVVEWARSHDRRWAFSLSNAGAAYAEFRSSLRNLDDVNWLAVESTDFQAPDVKEGKQAEFLVLQSFPWELVEEIGVADSTIEKRVKAVIQRTAHQPVVAIRTSWYY